MAQSKVVKQVLKATPRRRDSLDRSRGPFEKSPSMSPHDEDRPPIAELFPRYRHLQKKGRYLYDILFSGLPPAVATT